MKIIAFVGMPASGKSEASGVAKGLGIPVVNMGDVVREETANRGLLQRMRISVEQELNCAKKKGWI